MSLWLPILIILVPVLMILAKLSFEKNQYITNIQVIRTLLVSYVSILFISFIIYGLLPIKAANIQSVKEREANQISDKLYEDIFSGRIEAISSDYKKDEWTLDYVGKELKIIQSEGLFEGMIVVERKPENDGKIEGTYYMSRIVGGVDMTKEMLPGRVRLTGDSLELIGIPGIVSHNFTFTKKEFVISQFTGEKWTSQHSDAHRNIEVLYLKVPKTLDIINWNDLPIHHVGE